ncbi:hypothetical protein [Streptomyces sp. NPDC003077]|uniref:hypothetical protein n=1 Tax=Streptomyces sp. NPDC003077 TaxID=3154443 RepID=UPI0033B12012
MAEPLSPEAKATLEALLTGPDPVSRALRAQIPHARVTGHCGCGCATVDLTVDRTAVPPAPVTENPAADAWYAEPDDAGALVFTKNGYLSSLEVYSSSGESVAVWPKPRFQEG